MRGFFVCAVMAAVSSAAYSETPADETTATQSKFDNRCFFCIDEGFMFCSQDGLTGKCLNASCEEDTLNGSAKKANRAAGVCTLRDHGCAAPNTPMTSFTQCALPAQDENKCRTQLKITSEQVKSGGVDTVDADEEAIQVPYTQVYTIPSKGVCLAEISLDNTLDKTITRAAWDSTEWDSDIYVDVTRLDNGATWNDGNSAIFSAETYWYNRDTDDGDLAGRIPVKDNLSWKLVMLNYDETEGASQSIVIEYGAGVQTIVSSTLTLAAALLLAHSF